MIKPSFDFLTDERKARLRAVWEETVEERALVTYDAGSPSWMVNEEWDEKKEDFQSAAERVKARYFPKGRLGAAEDTLRRDVKTEHGRKESVGWGYLWDSGSVTKTKRDGPTVTNEVRKCDKCDRTVIGKARYCSGACRKRASRKK